MASVMKVALPVIAIGAAAFTGGASLGLFGADAGLEGIVGAGIAEDAGMADSMATGSSWFGSTIASIGSAYSSVSPYISALTGVASLAGTAMQAEGYNQQSQAVQEQTTLENQQLQNNANNDMATAEIKEQEQNRETAYVLSNAQEAAAASGGTSTDPTVTTNMKTIAGEGRYRALTDMYQGAAAAQGLQTEANLNSFNADLASQSDKNKMYSTILGGGSSLYDKYGTVKTKSGADNNGVNTNPLPWATN